MANFCRDLINLLKKQGCYYVREGKGDHEIWFSPITNRTVTIDKGGKSRHTMNAILIEAGLEKTF